MELDTVKVLSQNKSIRGQEFDVYYYEAFGNIELLSVEIPAGVKNLLTTLDEQSINDIRNSLSHLLTMRKIKQINASFTQAEHDASFAQDADANALKGLSND